MLSTILCTKSRLAGSFFFVPGDSGPNRRRGKIRQVSSRDVAPVVSEITLTSCISRPYDFAGNATEGLVLAGGDSNVASTPVQRNTKARGKGREEKSGPPTRAFPLPLTLLPLAFAPGPLFRGPSDYCGVWQGHPAHPISPRESNCTHRTGSTRIARYRGPAATDRPRPGGSGRCPAPA
jgi:hypothetical protein